MLRFIAELKRRRVISVAAYYVLGTWLILQVADILLPAWGVPPRAIQLVVYAALLGLPIALVFGWRYDFGPDGITRTAPASEGEISPADVGLSTKDFVLLGLMSLAILAVGTWVLERALHDEPAISTGPPNSVAVLLFDTGDEAASHAARALSEQVLDALIPITGLKVTGRESSFYFAGRDYSLDEIARMLNVRHLVTGQFFPDGDAPKLSVQLLQMPLANAQWARSYSTGQSDVRQIVKEIAQGVTQSLNVGMPDESRPDSEADAPERRAALDLLQLSAQALDSGDFQRAVAIADQAIEHDPDLARAYVHKATVHLLRFSSTGTPAVETVMQVAGESLDRARSLGANDADYYYARGMQARRAIWIDGGTPAWHKAVEENFRRTIALNPSDAQAYVSLSIYFRRNRRYSDATALLEKALEYDPLHPGAILQYSRNLSALGRSQEALENAMRLPALFGFGEREIALRYFESQRLDKAVEWYLRASPDDPRNVRDVGWLLGSLRANHRAITTLETIIEDENFGPAAQSMIASLNGDFEAAFALLSERIDENTSNREWLELAAPAALRAKRHPEAISLIEQAAPALSDRLAPEVTEQNAEFAVLLAVALKDSPGNDVRIGILSGMLLNLDRNRPATGWDGIGLRTARVYALQGESDKALEAIQSAYDQGFRQLYTYEGLLPLPLGVLFGDPRFDRLISQFDRDLAAMSEAAVALFEEN